MDGVWSTNPDQIANIAKNYYKELFSTSNLIHMDGVLNSVNLDVTNGMNQTLTSPYIAEEVCTALFQMHPSKVPGPNGMTPFFFQKFWYTIGPNVMDVLISV